jgi:hypothetical protein
LSALAKSDSISDAGSKLEQGFDLVKGNAGSIVKDAVYATALAAVKTAGQARGIDAEAIVGTALGVAINPGAAVMFKGVRLRPDHSFQWKLTPRNSAEAEAIKGIIGKLRRNMLPSVGESSLGMVFNYPQIFNIAILPEDNPFFPKFKSCFLESMEVNYAPSGPSFHGDNVPTEIDLKLTFQELVIFTANDFDEKTGDYVPPGFAPKPADMPVANTSSAGGFYESGSAKLRAKIEADVGREDRDPVGGFLPPTDPRLKQGTLGPKGNFPLRIPRKP